MSPGSRRMVGMGSVLVGIALASWLIFGPPRDWEGGVRWLRHGLAWASLGVIILAARLMFPDTKKDSSDTVPD
ncbi:hypothetical protein [Streptomyces sp. YS415]|uniref:hypothetical protein n=1 Tax=Streptomyces sp. YS415 TaxID=2944806 RepID=UPI002020D36F|nr:hypothetical protein [Streptomyces sp. YS415]MCL7430119.1 hypothetical protein [Streptomyces sp. YS415]